MRLNVRDYKKAIARASRLLDLYLLSLSRETMVCSPHPITWLSHSIVYLYRNQYLHLALESRCIVIVLLLFLLVRGASNISLVEGTTNSEVLGLQVIRGKSPLKSYSGEDISFSQNYV
jgi:hypothetical protein